MLSFALRTFSSKITFATKLGTKTILALAISNSAAYQFTSTNSTSRLLVVQHKIKEMKVISLAFVDPLKRIPSRS
jgi:hypothetical protein